MPGINQEQQKMFCSRCNATLKPGSPECEECGHPAHSLHGDSKEYKLMMVVGGVVLAGGTAAALAEAEIAAAVSIAIGAAVLCAGAIGAWWNKD